jgi:hypothetical protein
LGAGERQAHRRLASAARPSFRHFERANCCGNA